MYSSINFSALFCLFLTLFVPNFASVSPGIEQLLTSEHIHKLKGKKIGIITNQTAINRSFQTTIDLLKNKAVSNHFSIVALFAPEHGFNGLQMAAEDILDEKDPSGIPIYSLYGKNQRPTPEMLKGITLLIFDIQDIGTRSYTYASTLFYAMEAAAKQKIPVMVLDRPNPMNGIIVDGPMLDPQFRSIVGYINVPLCHGMTIGELAHYFNDEYQVGCTLDVIPMKGWKRSMTFKDTKLPWIPTSPYIPEPDTPFYYATTGIIGELQLVSIGIGYTMPFKLVGAPWIDADLFAKKLNDQKFPGVYFHPYHFKPIYGRCAKEICHGVLIVIADPKIFKPVATQYLLIGMLKGLYPTQFNDALKKLKSRANLFTKVNGTPEVLRILEQDQPVVWPLRGLHEKERKAFLEKRKKALISLYN